MRKLSYKRVTNERIIEKFENKMIKRGKIYKIKDTEKVNKAD